MNIAFIIDSFAYLFLIGGFATVALITMSNNFIGSEEEQMELWTPENYRSNFALELKFAQECSSSGYFYLMACLYWRC